MDEQNPTPSEGGASTLDRIQSYLSGETEPQPVKNEATPPNEPDSPVETVEPVDDGIEKDDGPQLSTSDLAKLLKLDENALDLDADGNAIFKTKVDGKEGAAKLQDLLKSYQLQEHVDKKVREAAEREKAIQAREQEVTHQFANRLQYAENLVNVAANDLLREFQSIDWRTIEQHDPGQAALLRQKFQDRQGQLRGVLQNVEAQKAQMAQHAVVQRQQVLQREAQKLPDVIPEWKDAATASKETGEIREWALKAGFQPEEIDNFALAHHVMVMRKAMLFDKLQQGKPKVENLVRNAPKLVKPGQAQPMDGRTQQMRNIKTQIKTSGGRKGIAEYLIASGKV